MNYQKGDKKYHYMLMKKLVESRYSNPLVQPYQTGCFRISGILLHEDGTGIVHTTYFWSGYALVAKQASQFHLSCLDEKKTRFLSRFTG